MYQGRTRLFLGYIPYHLVEGLVFRLRAVGTRLSSMFPDVKVNLRKAGFSLEAEDFFSFAIITYGIYGALIGFLLSFVSYHSTNELLSGNLPKSAAIGFGCWFLFAFLFLFLQIVFLGNESKSRSKQIDRVLLYAMKDLQLQVSSGNTLYVAMVEISSSNYGEVSKLFERIVRRINVGHPMKTVLEEQIRETDSEYLKRALWQMISSLRAGSDLKRTIGGIIEELNNDQKNQIMSYARELNLWSLFYMLFAVAIPTIGSTMLVILSTFAGFGIDRVTFVFFIVLCFVVQYSMIIFVKARRPVVQF